MIAQELSSDKSTIQSLWISIKQKIFRKKSLSQDFKNESEFLLPHLKKSIQTKRDLPKTVQPKPNQPKGIERPPQLSRIDKFKLYFICTGVFEKSDISVFQIDTGHFNTNQKFGLSFVNGDIIFPLLLMQADTTFRKQIIRGLELAAEEKRKDFCIVRDGNEIETKNQLIGQIGSAKYFIRKIIQGCIIEIHQIFFRVKSTHLKILQKINCMLLRDSGFTSLNYKIVSDFLKHYNTYSQYFEWRGRDNTDWIPGTPSKIGDFFNNLHNYMMIGIEGRKINDATIGKIQRIHCDFQSIKVHKGAAEEGPNANYMKAVTESPRRLIELVNVYGNNLHLRNFNMQQHEVFLKAFPVKASEIVIIPVINQLSVKIDCQHLITGGKRFTV